VFVRGMASYEDIGSDITVRFLIQSLKLDPNQRELCRNYGHPGVMKKTL